MAGSLVSCAPRTPVRVLIPAVLRWPAVLSWVASAALVGCAGNGDGLDANGRPVGEGGGGTSEFDQIQSTIFTPICTACHAGAGAPVGLRLDAGNSYALLVNIASVENPSLSRVKPGDPDNSYLVQKIEGRASVGGRMPLGGPPLPQASIDLVRSWIAAGAAAPPVSASASLQVLSTIPAADEESIEPVGEVLVMLNKEVDPSLVSAATVSLVASGGDREFDAGNEREVPLESARVPLGSPTLIAVKPLGMLPDDTYRLVLKGTGATAVAGVDARVLDGNADGAPGGDFTMQFQLASGVAR